MLGGMAVYSFLMFKSFSFFVFNDDLYYSSRVHCRVDD